MSDLDGTQPGSLRNLVTWRRASVRCSSSKCRRYFRTMVGIVMRKAVEKFWTAMACCFSGFVRKAIKQLAKSWVSPGW